MRPLILAIFLLSAFYCFGQTHFPTPIEIGEVCPDLDLRMTDPVNPFCKLSDYHGKIIVLDFWATGCQPCRALFKRIDTLEKKYGDRIKVLPISIEDSAKVASFLKDFQDVTGIHVNSSFHSRDVYRLFPHIYIPHEVWLDTNRVVIAETDFQQLNDAVVGTLVKGGTPAWSMKKDPVMLPLDYNKGPVILGGQFNAPDSLFLLKDSTDRFECIVTKPTRQLVGAAFQRPGSISGYNLSILWIYSFVAGHSRADFIERNRAILNVRDTMAIVGPMDSYEAQIWSKQHTFNFEFLLKDGEPDSIKYDLALAEVNKYFKNYHITGGIEQQTGDCYVLHRTTTDDRISSAGGTPVCQMNGYRARLVNTTLGTFFFRMQTGFLQLTHFPLIDESGLSNVPVDLDISCDLSKLDAVNAALKSYGLEFKKETRTISYLVIKDI